MEKEWKNGKGQLLLISFHAASVKMSSDIRTNRLVLIGTSAAINDLMALIKQLDRPSTTTPQSPIRFYTLKNVKVADLPL